MSRNIRELAYKEILEYNLLKRAAFEEKDFNKIIKLRKEQSEHHNKWEFLKNLNIAIEQKVSRETKEQN